MNWCCCCCVNIGARIGVFGTFIVVCGCVCIDVGADVVFSLVVFVDVLMFSRLLLLMLLLFNVMVLVFLFKVFQ